MSAIWRAAGAGLLAGARVMSPPALLAEGIRATGGTAVGPRTARVLKLVAAAEIIADKLPFVPARVAPVPLAARVISGAAIGMAVAHMEGARSATGALAGGLTTLAAAAATYVVRREAVRRAPVPDPILGIIEDVLVIQGGRAIFGRR